MLYLVNHIQHINLNLERELPSLYNEKTISTIYSTNSSDGRYEEVKKEGSVSYFIENRKSTRVIARSHPMLIQGCYLVL